MTTTHVLLVEDDDVIREATQLSLERDGFRVTVAGDGIAGLAAFRAERPDVALLDIMLPGINGVSLCRQIRDEGPTPVIMLSARADPVDVVLGLEAGADDYVTNPSTAPCWWPASARWCAGWAGPSNPRRSRWPSATWRSRRTVSKCGAPGGGWS
nr:response regulator [Allokutzneria sp. A3M-2-11 16]